MSVIKLEGVTIPGAKKPKKAKKKTTNPLLHRTLFDAKLATKGKQQGKLVVNQKISDSNLIRSVKIYQPKQDTKLNPKTGLYEETGQLKIKIKGPGYVRNPETDEWVPKIVTRTATYQLDKKETPYGEFLRRRYKEYKRENPNSKLTAPELSKKFKREWNLHQTTSKILALPKVRISQ